ncbi:sigma-70 family RNA polymerase sigma factor [Cryobacterium sp. TMT2-18-3]|uniref:sigma-70 family RNA polymerase sigma factor n=1 Tax=unclassified Cryobacterium TaxID=2649013 RepID=UPI00106B4C5D|nr:MULTISPECIES: sigma-70 family RNA polymerase sigma factor [unclassified Cryobacterium]TFC30971.1 sigma-70 family RNA polymerase sigma factor [Cryobacterium sp. TMT2-18-2]TFC34412.1 sigma-70 family RNA polymerase sigma factor [Cryobacterium sp. TMT2-42-4]TFC61387.1 sigma-70 family RNA polymerase sigma factor [Cryobacterium sp. TMT2-15-1]TFC63374.1 sigma-70 family RNA polymerase sigma factor [Cryobacterium sp. TMT2-18-3]
MNRAERNQLVIDNLPLVGYLVSETWAKARHLSRDDLASAGALALITSADAFNADLGVPFGAFARRRIIGAFADEMRSNDWATRMARRRIKETRAVQQTLAGALGRAASVDEVAAALGVDRETAIAGLADSERTVSTLDDATAEFLVSGTELPGDSLLSAERLAYLHAAIAALPEKMRVIVQQVYFDDRSVKEIAAELGITHSAVSQQRAEAIRLLRDGLGTHYADDAEAEYVPESRIAPARRSAYLARLADQAMFGLATASGVAYAAGSTESDTREFFSING